MNAGAVVTWRLIGDSAAALATYAAHGNVYWMYGLEPVTEEQGKADVLKLELAKGGHCDGTP